MYRSLVADLMDSAFGVRVPSLRLDPVPGAVGDLARYRGVYAWPDHRVEVAATADGLRIAGEEGEAAALPIDDHTFLVDRDDPDTPTVTFGAFDAAGRPRMLYEMIWGLPRVEE
jgi:hypothetical protein